MQAQEQWADWHFSEKASCWLSCRKAAGILLSETAINYQTKINNHGKILQFPKVTLWLLWQMGLNSVLNDTEALKTFKLWLHLNVETAESSFILLTWTSI